MAGTRNHSSGMDSTAIKLIPRPKVVSTLLTPSEKRQSLSFQMRLSRSPELLNMYCEVVEKVAQLWNEYKPTVSGPSKPGWQTFLIYVTKEVPLLHKYEDAWPVVTIVRAHRRFRPKSVGLAGWSKHKVQVTPSAGLKSPKPPAAQVGEDQPDADAESTPSSSISDVAKEQPNLARRILRDLSESPAATNASEETLLEGANDVPHTALTQPASTLTVGSQPKNAAVLAFLRKLVPDQTALLPVFIRMGVTNGTELHGLAQMPNRDEYVYSWVKSSLITELQFFVIVSAMRDLRTIRRMSSTVTA